MSEDRGTEEMRKQEEPFAASRLRVRHSDSSPGSVTLRLATPADVPAIAELIDASVRGLGPPHYTAAQIESSLVHLFGVDTAMIDDGTYFVVDNRELDPEQAPRLAGAGGWSRRRTPFGGDRAGAVRDDALRDPEREPAILRAFYVHPGVARRGVGRLLMDAAEAGARAGGFTRFELVSTLPGLEFYRRCGYRDLEPVEIPLPDGVSIGAVRMAKP